MPATVTEAEKGHAAHSKAADQPGLAGEFQRPIKLTFLGAGSNFCTVLCRDLMLTPGHKGGEIALVDIDTERLGLMEKFIKAMAEQLGQADQWKITASTDRREVLPGTDYMVCCVEVSGVDCVAFDNDIPLKYGVDQCIGDTIGPGGLFKALRTVPVFLDILRDARELCPQAVMLNYTNPMNIMCLAAGRAVPEVPVVGLCHSVQGTSHLLARYADVPYEEMAWECAGINHLAWFTKLEHKGRNLYESMLYEKFGKEVEAGYREAEEGKTRFDSADNVKWSSKGEDKPEVEYEQEDLIRKDMCLHFGAFITESSGHLSEYLPYYRKSDQGKKLLRLGYQGGSRFYATNWPQWRKNADAHRNRLISGEDQLDMKRSWEYGTFIIESMEKDVPFRIHGNVMNNDGTAGEAGKLITNLPGDGCVEVACMVDRNGINPTRYGALPPQMAAICMLNMHMFDLAATACIDKSKEAAVHALMLDPLTAAVLTPGEIRKMTYEMFDAEAQYLPGFE